MNVVLLNASSVVSRVARGARNCIVPMVAVLALMVVASSAMATDPSYTLPASGFNPANVTAMGTAALGGWADYLEVVIPIALILGITAGFVAYFLGLFHAKRGAAR